MQPLPLQSLLLQSPSLMHPWACWPLCNVLLPL
jgi:hypothetical protein